MDCPYCSSDVDNVIQHKKQFHESMEAYATEELECPYCGFKTADPAEHEDHKSSHANESHEDDEDEKEDNTIFNSPTHKSKDAGESWDFKSYNNKSEAFEGIGFNQGDALKMASLNWSNLSVEVQGALVEVEDSEKEEHRTSSNTAFDDEGDQPDNQVDDEINYNIISESQTSRTKYECEWCDHGARSNESLMLHYNDIHAKANEFMLEVPNNCPFGCGEIGANISMEDHLAYDHKIVLPQDGSFDQGDAYMNESMQSCPQCGFILSGEVKCPNCGKEYEFSMGNPEYQTRVAKKQMKQQNGYNNEDIMDDSRYSEYQNGGEAHENDLTDYYAEIGDAATLVEELRHNGKSNAEISKILSGMGVDPSYIGETLKKKSTEAYIVSPTEIVSYASEDNINREPAGSSAGGQFTSGSGGKGINGEPTTDKGMSTKQEAPTSKFSSMNDKDIVKSIKGGSKNWKDWNKNENNEDAYAEIERRNRAIPKPTSKRGGTVFQDDPEAVGKQEQVVKHWEDQKDYWKKITKEPSRTYGQTLGDAVWYMGSNVSTNLRTAKKKLDKLKADKETGVTLTREPTYKDNKKRFYYKRSDEPKSGEV